MSEHQKKTGRIVKFLDFYFISNKMIVFSEFKTYMDKALRKIIPRIGKYRNSKKNLECSSKLLTNPGASEYE